MGSSSIHFREVPISGHIFRRQRKSGDRWMAKWRDAEGQHQIVLGKAWTKRGKPAAGYLTKQGAQRELDAILADARKNHLTSRPRRASTVTFAEAAREWLRYVEHDRKRRPSTISDYRWIVERRLIPAFGTLALESITTQRIDAWREKLVEAGGIADEEGLSARTINKYLGAMHSMRAQRAFGLSANAAAWAERPPVMRSGDLRPLGGRDQVTVALDGLSRREEWTGEEDLAFVNPGGEHIEDSALRRRFYAALEAAGLEHIRFHDLRHSFGTLAVQVFPLTDVRAYMGHADIATTMIYVHHVPQVDAAEKLSAALRDASTAAPASALAA
jgi:hypothetical protein